MTNDEQTPAGPGSPATREQIAAYRAGVARLLARCLERITAWPVADDVEPLPQWRPHRD